MLPFKDPDTASAPSLWYESSRDERPDYDTCYKDWIARVHRGEPAACALARDILGASEYHPWFASAQHHPAQYYVMGVLAGCPDPAPWMTLWRELIDEHQEDPASQKNAWITVRHTVMAQALRTGHPSVAVAFLDWNRQRTSPYVWTIDEQKTWVDALTIEGRGDLVPPPAEDPERNGGVKLLALLDAGHLDWSVLQQACASPKNGMTMGNLLWQTPGMGVVLERAHVEGHHRLAVDDVYHLWCSDDPTLWALAERLDTTALCQGVNALQAHAWWPGGPDSTGPGPDACARSRAAWWSLEARLLRNACPSSVPVPASPPRRL